MLPLDSVEVVPVSRVDWLDDSLFEPVLRWVRLSVRVESPVLSVEDWVSFELVVVVRLAVVAYSPARTPSSPFCGVSEKTVSSVLLAASVPWVVLWSLVAVRLVPVLVVVLSELPLVLPVTVVVLLSVATSRPEVLTRSEPVRLVVSVPAVLSEVEPEPELECCSEPEEVPFEE